MTVALLSYTDQGTVATDKLNAAISALNALTGTVTSVGQEADNTASGLANLTGNYTATVGQINAEIAAESTARANAITAEAGARAAAVAAEAQRATGAENGISANLNNLGQTLSGDVAQLSASITAGDTTERNRATAAEGGIAADLNNLGQTLSGDVQQLVADIAAEATSRTQADATEASARQVSIAAEATSRTPADAAEAASRTQADAGISANVTGLGSTLSGDVAQLAADIQASVNAEGNRAELVENQLSAAAQKALNQIAAVQASVGILQATMGQKFDALGSVIAGALLGDPASVGDDLFLFTGSKAGLPAACPPLPGANVIVRADGTAFEAVGHTAVATRVAYRNEAGRAFAVRFAYARPQAPSDRTTDLVRCGIACLDQNFAMLSTLTLKDDVGPGLSAGLRSAAATVVSSSAPIDGVVLPDACVYWRPFIEGFGIDAVTDYVTLAVDDVTAATFYTPDFSPVVAELASLRSAVAALDPLAAGQANGLATLDSTGAVAQVPPLKQDFFLQANAIYPGAMEAVDAAVTAQSDETLVIRNRSPFVRAGDPWLSFAQVVLGLTNPQIGSILAAISRPSPAAVYPRANPLQSFDVETAAVLRAARDRFTLIPRAAMKDFRAGFVGDEDAPDDSYYAYFIDPRAPIAGPLYGMLLAYLTSASPGPALTVTAAKSHLAAVWSTASPIPS